jgi:glycine dehydrogenase subunit 1
MHEFIPHTPEDERRMLQTIGLSSVDELFADIPKEILDRHRPLGLKALSELDVKRELQRLARKNADPERAISFLGAGIYDHYIPSVVNYFLQRGEFLTGYTPYQAEMSQGTLTALFEFQTMVCELTGMDVANASMYDGSSALAEAMLLAHHATGRKKYLIAESVHSNYRAVVGTYAWAADLELITVPSDKNGQLDRASLKSHISDDIGGLLIQTPNFMGIIEDLSGLKEMLGDALLCVSTNPIALGLLEPPGTFEADVVTGEGQPLGNAQNFGGPLLGLFACRKAHLHKMPGRIIGRTVDADGQMGYIMTLQAREQHIRRSKATSNICTNQTLLALGATIYLASLGKRGLRRLAEINAQKAHYLARRITALPGYALRWPQAPFFNEFVVRTPNAPEEILDGLRKQGILGGLSLEPYGYEQTLLIAVTEQRTRAEMDHYVQTLKEMA